MAQRRHCFVRVALLVGLLLVGAAHAQSQAAPSSCTSGAADSCALETETSGPEIHVEDGMLSDELRDELIKARRASASLLPPPSTAAA